jgi:tetratricopeptide (TPR) repeat protein
MPADKEEPGSIFRQIGTLTKATAARWLAALQNSGDLRSRAAGLLLESKVTDGDSGPRAEQIFTAAVQLAAGAEDPAVYGLAVSMCGRYIGTDAAGACQQISLQRWAQLDPDNAVPWLFLAAAAQASHDTGAEADAFSHAAKAHKVDSYGDSLFAFAEPELPQDVTPLARSYFAIEVIGVEAALWAPQYGAVNQHCSREAMQDSNVRQQCDSLAQLLVRNGTTLLDLGLGRNIGARAGWSSERVNELAQQQDALRQAITQLSPSDDDKLWTCDAVSRMNAYMSQRVRLGELGAAREVLERSGETDEAMHQKYLQYLDAIRREAPWQEPQNFPQTTR